MKTLTTLALFILSLSAFGQVSPTFTNPVTDEDGNKTYIYRSQVLNTIFTLPIVRANFLTPHESQQQSRLVTASFFSSVGAGLGYTFGRIEELHDEKGKLISQTLTNIFSVKLGILFASNPNGIASTTTITGTPPTNSSSGTTSTTSSSSSTATNIFALHAGLSILNFELGAGYELGTINPGHRRGFVTVSYGIPLSTLVKGAYLVVKRKKVPVEDLPNALE